MIIVYNNSEFWLFHAFYYYNIIIAAVFSNVALKMLYDIAGR